MAATETQPATTPAGEPAEEEVPFSTWSCTWLIATVAGVFPPVSCSCVEHSHGRTFTEQCVRFLDLDHTIAPWNQETHPFGKSWEKFAEGLITPITAVGSFPSQFDPAEEWDIWGGIIKEKIIGMKAENRDKNTDTFAEMKKSE
eukprot:1688649-Rhodomonas_salina.3